MTATLQPAQTVGEAVARRPELSRIFERLGIDYCCGGKRTLDEAARDKGLDARTLLAVLEAAEASGGAVADAASMSITELADHIENTHHNWLRTEMPRLISLAAKVAQVHGNRDPRLGDVFRTLRDLAAEMQDHMAKEENVFFPYSRALDKPGPLPPFPCSSGCGSAAGPVRILTQEHENAGEALEKLKKLTDGYAPPEWACGSYRALLEGLRGLELDMHQHVHKENNILFPRVVELEASKPKR